MTHLWNDPRWIRMTPLITTFLLETANVGQIWRMWTTQTARGQSLFSWMMVGVALGLWYNFYRVVTPQEIFARRCTAFGVLMNLLVILTVCWFRYGVKTG